MIISPCEIRTPMPRSISRISSSVGYSYLRLAGSVAYLPRLGGVLSGHDELPAAGVHVVGGVGHVVLDAVHQLALRC